MAEALSVLVIAAGEALAGSLLFQTAGVLKALATGVQVFRAELAVSTATTVRGVMWAYVGDRDDGKDADLAWFLLYQDFAPILEEWFTRRAGVEVDQLPAWFESFYLAFRLVGYPDSQMLREAQGRGIAAAAARL